MAVPSYLSIPTLTNQQQGITNALGGAIGRNIGIDPLSGINADNTAKYVQQSVATPLLRQYDQSIMPRIRDSYASVGALLGSHRAYAEQNALENLQTTMAAELGKAQLSNQQLSANLGAQMNLGYGQMGVALAGQPHMAIQPYVTGGGIQNGGMPMNNFFGGSFGQMNHQSPFAGNGFSRGFGGYNQSRGQMLSYGDMLDQNLQDNQDNYQTPTYGDYPFKSPEVSSQNFYV